MIVSSIQHHHFFGGLAISRFILVAAPDHCHCVVNCLIDSVETSIAEIEFHILDIPAQRPFRLGILPNEQSTFLLAKKSY